MPDIDDRQIIEQLTRVIRDVQIPVTKELDALSRQLELLNGASRINATCITVLQEQVKSHTEQLKRQESLLDALDKAVHVLDISAARLTVMITGGAGVGGVIGAVLVAVIQILGQKGP